MKVILCGFGPFDGLKENPSAQLVYKLSQEMFQFELIPMILPVSFKSSFTPLKKEIEKTSPDYVIATGLAGIRNEITLEKIAINFIDARIPDNDGEQPRDQKIQRAGPDGLFSSLPLSAMLKTSSQHKLPVSLSTTAGTYVCNYLMYEILFHAQECKYKGGFIHVPPTPELKLETQGLPLEKTFHAFKALLNSL